MNATKTSTLIESDLQYLSAQFESRPVEEILAWAVPQFAPRIAMTSSFGTEGIVLIDHLAKLGIKLPVIYLDTGFHFPATEELKDQLQERYDLDVRSFSEQMESLLKQLRETDRVPAGRLACAASGCGHRYALRLGQLCR